MAANEHEAKPYTVRARVIVQAPDALTAQVFFRMAVNEAPDHLHISGAILETARPSEPADVAWVEATR